MTTEHPATTLAPHGSFVDIDGRRFTRIDGYDLLEPFLMTLAGASDVWCFVSSTGGLTAGRGVADRALFPYDTEDKVADSAGRTGGLTLLRVATGTGAPTVWEPVTGPACGATRHRSLAKDVLGATLVFEEARPDLGLSLQVGLTTSDRFGLVRECTLTSTADRPVQVDLVDGFVNLLPPDVGVDLQRRRSSLVDAYKRAEADTGTGLALLYLASRVTDLAEPSESLSATVAWQVGLPEPRRLLSARQVPAFHRGEPVQDETEVRGERGAYLTATSLTVDPGTSVRWWTVADIDYDAPRVLGLRRTLEDSGVAAALQADVERTRVQLSTLLGLADGRQLSGDEAATTHHLANVLFNTMRGGVPASGYDLDGDDVRAFVSSRSPRTARRCRQFLSALGHSVRSEELVRRARALGDADLERLAVEYLPLVFSRRHGDPSRPWNEFSISLRTPEGTPRLGFEGNWRDIFQNWEAMAWSFPEYLESMITIFVDATTVDGYNPYRISRDGVDWEVPDPDDPWANIGYWSDHQIVYLLRLLEASERFHPGRLRGTLGRRVFTYADVPYRLATYAQTVLDPHDTVTFDQERAEVIAVREADEGADGRLVHGPDGDLVRVTLAEKLLLLLAAKLVNFVPDGGIWMNTQRPEWNDANNALVGRGLSVVTVAYLRRYVVYLQHLFDEDVTVGGELAHLLGQIGAVLSAHEPGDGFSPADRAQFLDGLGEAGSTYRAAAYEGLTAPAQTLPADQVARLLETARHHLDACLHANMRTDGLTHSYNLLDRGPDGVQVRRLPEMLEGQVAVLSSGLLDPDQGVRLLRALRTSRLYVEDRNSYLLYPDRRLPTFLERNTVPAERAGAVRLVASLVEAGDRSIVVPDADGGIHFAAPLRNAKDVRAALARLRDDPRLATLVDDDGPALVALFDDTFAHTEFTGRAGSFFGYEGLGSVYWHMVSKLLLATLELHDRAVAEGADPATVAALADHYEDVRSGLGYCRTPSQYGAFPTDPYSHTPAGHGARQPGMTGQVKEEVLTRFAELGLRVEDGCIVIRPDLLRPAELLDHEATFSYVGADGTPGTMRLRDGSLAFTFCQVPVQVRRSSTAALRVHTSDGTRIECDGGVVPPDLSRSVFGRDGGVRLIEVDTPLGTDAPTAG